MPLTSAMLSSRQLEKNARPVRVTGRSQSYSEELITPEIAITSSAVISIITIIAQDTASLPLLLYARKGRNKFRAYNNPYYRLMHDQPNPEMTSMVFRELIVSHLIAWGNFYAQMITDDAGVVTELWPLRPDRMSVERVEGVKIYRYQPIGGQPRSFFGDEIVHIPGWGFDGLIGYSKIALARNAIGLAISTEKYGSKFFSNGANFDIAITHPGTLSETAFGHLSDSLKEKHAGIENSHKPMILEEGMSIEKIGIPPDDAQFLETRKFQLAEINRIIGPLPPHMMGDMDKSTSWGTGIDSQEQGYVNHTLRPYAVRTEQALNTQLLLPADRADGYFFEHLFDGLLRGDIATRFESYVKAINNGIMSPNEVRAKENLNAYKNGDVFWRPLNMVSTTDTATDPQTVTNALEPLWRNAVARVMKRESNDLSGASKRYQSKGQQEAFDRWTNQFYVSDHLEFIRKEFQPLIEAALNLNAVDDSERLEGFILQYLNERHEQVKGMSAQELSDGMDAYIANATNRIMDVVGDCFGILPRNDIMEFADE